jgi:hypothetical protein
VSAPAAGERRPRPSAFRLTDADVGHVDDDDYFGEAAAEGEAATGETDPAGAMPRPVQVTAWDRGEMAGGDGLEVSGRLTNQGVDTAVSIVVTVALFDHEGALLATAPAQLAGNALAPGEETDISASFPGIYVFPSVNFDVRQRGLRSRPAEESPATDTDPTGDTDSTGIGAPDPQSGSDGERTGA